MAEQDTQQEESRDTSQHPEDTQGAESARAETRGKQLLEEAKQCLKATEACCEKAKEKLRGAKEQRKQAQKDLKTAKRCRDKARKRRRDATKEARNARKKRAEAEKSLSDSLERLKQIQHSLSELRTQQDQARREGVANEAKLQELDGQIQEVPEREEDQTSGNALKQMQSSLSELRTQQDQARREGVANEAKLQELDGQIQDEIVAGNRDRLTRAEQNFAGAEQNFASAEQEFVKAKKNYNAAVEPLKKARCAVFNAAVTLNRTAAVIPWRRLKVGILNLYTSLSLLSTTTVGYAYAVVLGGTYELVFYNSYSINIFDYATFSDFFLSGLKVVIIPFAFIVVTSLFLFTPYWLISLLARLPIPVYARCVAAVFPRLVERIPVKKGLLVLFIFLSGVSAVLAGKLHYNYNQDSEKPVSIVTTLPLQHKDNLVRIGSNSSYTFFKKRNGGASAVLAVPLSQIVCISETDDGGQGCTSEETIKGNGENTSPQNIVLSKKDNPWIDELIQTMEENITENGVRHYISQQMACDKDQRLEVSDFIRFEWSKAALDPTEEGKVVDFVDEWKERPEKWAVFGFASPDGERGVNKTLSKDRAKAVESELCAALDAVGPKRECEERDVAVKHFDEDHPINGIANSRSARIAVCTKERPDPAARPGALDSGSSPE